MIYVIRGPHDYLKVGVSRDPLARLATLQTGSPVPLELVYAAAAKSGDATAIEQAAHSTMQRHWQAGEWFDVSADLAIAAIAAASYRMGDPIVEIAKENIAYVVDRAQREAAQDAEGPPKRRGRPGLYSALAVSPIVVLMVAVYKPDSGTYGVADFVGFAVISGIFWLPAYLVSRLIYWTRR